MGAIIGIILFLFVPLLLLNLIIYILLSYWDSNYSKLCSEIRKLNDKESEQIKEIGNLKVVLQYSRKLDFVKALEKKYNFDCH